MSVSLRLAALNLHQLLTGRRVLGRLRELDRTQWLDKASLERLQWEKLCQIVEYAYLHVPYYKRVFDQAGFRPEEMRGDPGSFKKIPVLTKALLRENYNDLSTTEPRRRKELTISTTGGSTGTPMRFMLDHGFRDYATADIQRHLGWAGWRLGQRHAYIWGTNFEAKTQEKLRTRMLDWTWNRFLTNAYALNDASLAAFAARVHKERPKILFGYAGCLHRFAKYVRESCYHGMTFNGIFSSAEVLLPSVREYVEGTFQCRVFNRYGSRELGGIACECPSHAGVHVSAENNYVEIIKDGKPARPGEVGDFIITNLNNRGMPLIRFQNEDAGSWREETDCACGRGLPIIETIQGRIVDTFFTSDGQAIYGGFGLHVFPALDDLSVKKYQIIQKSLDLILFRLVKHHEIPQYVLDDITQMARGFFGARVQVEFEFPDEIPVLPSGKYRYMVSEVKSKEKSGQA